MVTKIIILLLAYNLAYPGVITVSGRTDYDIQVALNMAKQQDTVRIPGGDYYFSTGVVVSKGVVIAGSGYGQSRIMRAPDAQGDFWFITIDGRYGNSVRVSGLAFKGKYGQTIPGILIDNECVDFRIDNCLFERCSKRAIEIRNGGRGVIHSNRFIDNWPTAIVVFGKGDEEWNRELSLGCKNAVFVEDNYFQQSDVPDKAMAHHIASNNGSRYVFRYNTINDGKMASHAIDAHGNKFGWKRGSRSYEIYGNSITATHRWAGINIRGGDGVIFNNRFYGSFVSPVHLMHEGRDGDGNCIYPCIDQIRLLHLWDNFINGRAVKMFVRHSHIISEGRDYHLFKPGDYKPFQYPHPLRMGD